MTVWAVVVAAGRGTRFGTEKQFEALGDTTVVDRSVETARATCDGVAVVVPADAKWSAPAGVLQAVGGATRSDSVRAGLELVPVDAEIVVVHDAARPLASADLFRAVIAAVERGATGAVPGLAVSDTLKRVEGERVLATVAREDLVAVQTPQAFDAAALRAAHASGGVDTDDAALIEAAGGVVVVVPGDRRNLKITDPRDLALAAALEERR